MKTSMKKNNSYVIFYLKCLLVSYILTVGLLLFLALFLYRFGLSEKIVSVAIILIYIAASLFAGLFPGKRWEHGSFCGDCWRGYFILRFCCAFPWYWSRGLPGFREI